MINRSIRASLLAPLAGLLGTGLLAVGLSLDARRTWFAYLVAWTSAVTLSIGALLLLMVSHAAKAAWMVVTRRSTEALAGALPLHALLFVPLCFGLRELYPWVAHPDAHRHAYLNVPFFVTRSAFYLGVLSLIGALLRRWSRINDIRPSMRLVRRMRALSGGGLPLVALVTTWASFDWTMSLQPDWSSTIFGLYFFAGAFAGAIALVSVVTNASRLDRRAPWPVTADHAQALGRLLFAMVSFWAYMAFSQLLVYWIGDIPHDVTFYALRTTGSWAVVTGALVCGNFVVPFFALLNRRWKRRAHYLAAVALWVLAMHVVDVYWLVMPVCDRSGARPQWLWLDLAAFAAVGGVSWVWVARRYRRVPALPVHDPELAEGLGYEAAL